MITPTASEPAVTKSPNASTTWPAAAVPGTLANVAAGGGLREVVRFGHPSGTMRVGADVKQLDGRWAVSKAVMSRSARVLMDGAVRVPDDFPGVQPARSR